MQANEARTRHEAQHRLLLGDGNGNAVLQGTLVEHLSRIHASHWRCRSWALQRVIDK